MKSVRVVLALVGLLALPLVAAAAQGQSEANKCKNTPQAGQNGNSQPGAAAVAVAQADKCPAPLSSPPTGQNMAGGVVFEDLDGNGAQDQYAGELGLAGWPVELWWNGQVVATTTTDDWGNFMFSNLGNTSYSVCVQIQAGYTETYPLLNGGACGGLGWAISFNSVFPTLWPTNFGLRQ